MTIKNQMIDAKSAIGLIDTLFPGDPMIQWLGRTVLEKLPKVDAVEVVHGEWEIVDFAGNMQCSVCGKIGCKLNNESNYCPNCGARMDLVVN